MQNSIIPVTLANQLPKFGNNALIANKGRNGPEFTITSGLFFLIALITASPTFYEEIVPRINGAFTLLSEYIPTSFTKPGKTADTPTGVP